MRTLVTCQNIWAVSCKFITSGVLTKNPSPEVSAVPLTRQPIRIVLVDIHTLVRASVRMMLESWEQFKVVGDTGNETEALALVENEKPDIVVMELDFKLGERKGLELLSKLLSSTSPRIIVLTHLQDVDLHHRAIQCGARGLVLKEHSPEQLRSAILKVNAGEVWLDDTLTTSIITRIAQSSRHGAVQAEPAGLEALSRRESQLAQLAADGLSNREIAARLYISETTVRHHLTSIFRKLNLANRLELIIYVLRPKIARKVPSASTSDHVSHPSRTVKPSRFPDAMNRAEKRRPV
jgi:two-component system, NarL family, nitrate/nitrite response regulator NarL